MSKFKSRLRETAKFTGYVDPPALDALDQKTEHARPDQAKHYDEIMPSAVVSPAPTSIHSPELLLPRALGAQGFRAPDKHRSKRARQPDFAEQKRWRKRRRFTLFATHKKLRQESTFYWIDEGDLKVNVRRERFLFPHFRPIVINPNATWAGNVRLPRTIETIGLKYSSHIYVMTSCFLVLVWLFVLLQKYDIAFPVSMGVLPISFLLVLAQPRIATLCLTSFMPSYIMICQTALIIIVSILYDSTLGNIATATIWFHSSVAIFFDAMPMTVKSKVYAMLPVYILICVSGSIKMLLDQSAPESSQYANIPNHDLRESLASRAASFSVNVAIFGVHIFVSVWRRPAVLASVPAQMHVIKAVPRSLSRIVAQIHVMQAWERRSRQSDMSYKNSFRDPGAGNQRELVQVLLSPVVPVLINSRESIGVFLFGKRIGNLPFLLHKHVPGYPILAPLLMFAAFAVLGWALFPRERVSKTHWIPVVVLVGWNSLATVPLANVRLCRLLLADFETRMFFAIETICIALMVSMYSWEADLILISALAALYNSIISDAWPSFIVQGRKRAIGHGLNFILINALYVGSRLNILLDGIDEERNHLLSFAGKIHIDVKSITESMLLMIAVFSLRCLMFSLVRPASCVILKAPVVSITMPREELTRYELLYKEAVRKARHSDQVADKADIAPIQSESNPLTEITKAKEQMEQRFASLQEQD